MKNFFIFTLLFQVCLFSASLEDFSGLKGTLRIAGGTAHIPVMKEVAAEIGSKNPDIRIAIAGGGSGVGIKKAGEGLVDIGNSGRRPSGREIERYGLKLYKWAVDGIAVVVNPNNPVKSLKKDDIKRIFSGEIRNWKDLGGDNAAINLYTRDSASGTRKVFWKKLLEKGEITGSANFVASNGAMKISVAGDPNAIGFMSAGFIDGSVAGVEIDGIAPSSENISSGRYPYARGIYSLTRGEASALAKVFLDYMLSDHVQHELIPKKGFIPIR